MLQYYFSFYEKQGVYVIFFMACVHGVVEMWLDGLETFINVSI